MPVFNRNKLGELRPNQIITTFGPGAIVDAVKDSVMVLDINYWEKTGKEIIDRRLASYLKVDKFFMPRTTDQGNDIPVVTFPYMHVCSKCGLIFDARKNFDLDKYLKFGVTCPDCSRQAYPSRFVIMCENGHIDDFPWRWWVHRGNTECEKPLKMYSTGNTSTLADLWITCGCGARRNMTGSTQKEKFEGLACNGHHPFRPGKRDKRCDKPVIPSQRGASNVYFPVSRSAISIPPWINPLYTLITEQLPHIEYSLRTGGNIDQIYNYNFAAICSREEFDKAFEKIKNGVEVKEFTEIKQMEYRSIKNHMDPSYALGKIHFKTEKEEEMPPYFKPYFSRIIRITRLREVKVLLGFTRVDASDPDAEEQPNIVYLNREIAGTNEKWLPAAEINGEGIFIEFNKDTLHTWLADNDVKEISKKYIESYEEFCNSRGWTKTVDKDACYVLLHTFAHLLIKQMAMYSGYSSSAIRERIYFGKDMAGILLYTGSADKEGSLGGLVELGTISMLRSLMKDMFQEALFCTNDPECLSNMPDVYSSNGAACHSCCMISETACENGNRMLDRGLVVPIENRENQAYFTELVIELCQLKSGN